MRPYLSPVGRAHYYPKRKYNFLVFGAPASLIGSELSTLVGSGPSLCPDPIAYAATSESATRTTIPDVWKIGESERRERCTW